MWTTTCEGAECVSQAAQMNWEWSEILSAVSLVISVVAVVFTLAWRSRPYLRVERIDLLDNSTANEQPTLRIRLANRGNGEAWDVRVHAKPGDGSGSKTVVGTLKPDQVYDDVLFVTPFIPADPSNPLGDGTWADGPVSPKEIRLVVRWRQLPVIRWYKKKTFKIGHKTEYVTWNEYDAGDELGKSTVD